MSKTDIVIVVGSVIIIGMSIAVVSYLHKDVARVSQWIDIRPTVRESEPCQCLRPLECPDGWDFVSSSPNGVFIRCAKERNRLRTILTIDRSLPPEKDLEITIDLDSRP